MGTTEIRLVAVGDVCLNAFDGDPFVHVGSAFGGDIRFCNLECALTRRDSAADKNVVFAARPESADHLVSHGFDVVCLANNHVLDFGPDGLADTLDALEERGLRFFGAGRSATDAAQALFFERNGATVAVVGTADASGGPASGPTVSAMSIKAMCRAVSDARKRADVVIASYHGGIELDPSPSPFVVRGLRSLVDAGADVVLGHHPHVLQPVEIYKGRIIAYSLGNFVFNNERYGDKAQLAATTMILEATVKFDGTEGAVTGVSHSLVPVRIGGDAVPRLMDAAEQEGFFEYMKRLGARVNEIAAEGADVRRMENMASEFHQKSLRTIIRYGIRHARDFSFKEIFVGFKAVLRNAVSRRFGPGKRR